ncbi:MAG: class I SAM-dependent methyltransferase [Gammaproteobacteria bacterium]|nr:class I SAM-dependent methyltransferase [Gammaproteobacteria bacterium]
MKPYAESSAQNRAPIEAVLKQVLKDSHTVLEIGSGTGQHAVYFSKAMPWLQWQPSELKQNLGGIQLWLDEAGLENISKPIALNVASNDWPSEKYDAAYSANTSHIMSWQEVEDCFRGIAMILKPEGQFCLYGPFNYGGDYTSDSNARFDAWLKQQNAKQGLRDFEALDKLAYEVGLAFSSDFEMPVNNRLLVWKKRP